MTSGARTFLITLVLVVLVGAAVFSMVQEENDLTAFDTGSATGAPAQPSGTSTVTRALNGELSAICRLDTIHRTTAFISGDTLHLTRTVITGYATTSTSTHRDHALVSGDDTLYTWESGDRDGETYTLAETTSEDIATSSATSTFVELADPFSGEVTDRGEIHRYVSTLALQCVESDLSRSVLTPPPVVFTDVDIATSTVSIDEEEQQTTATDTPQRPDQGTTSDQGDAAD